MKILLPCRPGGAFGFITDGWFNAFRDKGHTVRRWDGDEGSWRSFNPDLYLGASGHRQPIPPKRGNCKVAIHANPYGPVKIDGINEPDDAIRWVINQRPDVVFGYGFENDRILWSYWAERHGIPWVPMPTAADKTMFYDLNKQREFDVVYLGGRWAYKGITIDAYLIPVLKDQQLKCKLYGWGDWPSSLCSGVLVEEKANDFLNSGLIGPCMSERHTHQYGIDIPERAWKVALCGTLVVHDPVPTMRREFTSAVIAQDAKNYHDLIVHYSRNHDERLAIVAKQKAEVLEKHTYHKRLAVLLRELGFAADADDMEN